MFSYFMALICGAGFGINVANAISHQQDGGMAFYLACAGICLANMGSFLISVKD